MNVVFISAENPAPWQKALRRHLPEADLFIWGQDDLDPATMDYALVWKPEPGLLTRFANLKGIFNLGAGVDALLQDQTLPRHIPLVRLVDPLLSSGMVEYAVHWVLHFHRGMHIYARQQRAQDWTPHANATTKTAVWGFWAWASWGKTSPTHYCCWALKALRAGAVPPKTCPACKALPGMPGTRALKRFSSARKFSSVCCP